MMKFSIVTVSFNQAPFLERALKSVIDQDYDDLEYIVVDGGSTDGSIDIIERYRKDIDHVIIGKDRGPADALNKGFKLASGELLGFLNSDDVLTSGALKEAAAMFAEDPSTDVISGHSRIVDENDRLIRNSYSDPFSLKMYIHRVGVLMQASTFFRASAFRSVGGFNVENRVAWDGELFVGMAKRGARFKVVDRFWSLFRVHQSSITGSMRLNTALMAYYRNEFIQAMGRPPRRMDRLVRCALYGKKYMQNPAAFFERILKGPVYGRSR